MTRLTPRRLIDDDDSELSFEIECVDDSNLPRFQDVRLRLPRAEMSLEHVRFLILRLLCHAMIERIPDKGIWEACDSLKQCYDYYRLPVSQPAEPMPKPAMVRNILPRVEEPPFHIAED
jgi:hypothetical protein